MLIPNVVNDLLPQKTQYICPEGRDYAQELLVYRVHLPATAN